MKIPTAHLTLMHSHSIWHLLAPVCAGCISTVAMGQVISWNSTNGLWNTPANWQGQNTPNTQAETAQIDAPGAYIVSHPAIPTSIQGLNLLNPSAQLNFDAGSALRIGQGGIRNDSIIVLNSDALSLGTSLTLLNSTTLSGSGQLFLNASTSSLESSIITSTVDSVQLTQDSSHTIRGSGSIYLNLINNGTIAADLPGQILRLHSQPKTNNNLFVARNGASLILESALTQSSTGVILAENSEVQIASSLIGGALVATGPNGRFSLLPNAYLVNTTLTGAMNVPEGITTVSNRLTNNGVITINTQGSNTPAVLLMRFNTFLSGAGCLVLNASSTNPNSALISGLDIDNVLNNGAEHTICGSGTISAAVTNVGEIIANIPGTSLTIRDFPLRNLGTVRALHGSTINVVNLTSGNSENSQYHAAGGTINLDNAFLYYGRVLTTDNGSIRFHNTCRIAYARINAEVAILPYSTLETSYLLENNGIISVNSTTAQGTSTLRVTNSLLIEGSGRILLNANPSNLSAALIDSQSISYTLTLSPAQSLEGSGRIYARTICQGILSPGLASQPIGHLSFGDSGRLTLSPTSTLNIQIGGPDSTQSDLISSALEPIYLYGTLNISSLTGLTPAPGQTWTIMTGPSFIGTFANIQFPTLSPSGGFRINYLPTSIQLEYFCYADANEDGGIDGSDIQAFFTLWELSDSAADLNLDGGVDGADLELFFTSWESGNC